LTLAVYVITFLNSWNFLLESKNKGDSFIKKKAEAANISGIPKAKDVIYFQFGQ